MGLLAFNIGSFNQTRGGSSDTEADFLDKSFDSKKDAIKRANKALQGDDEYKSNMADDEHSVCGSERVCDKKSQKVDISPPLPLIPFSPQGTVFDAVIQIEVLILLIQGPFITISQSFVRQCPCLSQQRFP